MNQTYTERTAAAVRAELARRQVTAKSVCAATDITPARLSRRLNGLIPFDVAELAAIADHLQVPVSTFLPDVERVA